MATILVVDDESNIRDVVCFALRKADFTTVEAVDGAQAIELFQQVHPDLVILDVVMPERDGFDVCRELRRDNDTPIVFLTSRDEEVDRIIGFELGGDDYVTKPFSPRELVARVKAVLRRGVSEVDLSTDVFRFANITVDTSRHTVLVESREITLTATEFAMLRTLIEHPGNVYSREQLMQHAYELQRVVSDRTIDSHIRRLRKKLRDAGADVIKTVHGVGFRLAHDVG